MFRGFTQDTIDFSIDYEKITINNGWMNTGMNTRNMYLSLSGNWQLKWGTMMLSIEPELDLRPQRMVSRINRDIRYTK